MPLLGADYYWVGGSGKWSDISHWATTSGGTAQHNQIPTARDRVFFDARSFTGPGQSVEVELPIYCMGMDWTGAVGKPRFFGPATASLNLYGGIALIPDMAFEFKGDIHFLANTAGHRIDLAGHPLRQNAFFSGTGGNWQLAGAFRVDSLLRFSAGTFLSANHPIYSELLQVKPSSPLLLNLGSSEVSVSGKGFFPDYQYRWERDYLSVDFSMINLTLIATGATIDCQAPYPIIWIHDSGKFNLGTLRFSSTTGKTTLLNENNMRDSTSIKRLEIRNDASVKGSLRVDTLHLGAGKNFTFQAGGTYQLGTLEAFGTCPAPIQVFSDNPGTAILFKASSGTLKGNFLSVQDVQASGGAEFIAENGADLGRNTGWKFVPKSSNGLYWVGGTGNWSDPMHWALSSGGQGGVCVPTAADDVFFDANSFPTPLGVVTLDIDNPYCKSMHWTGATGKPMLYGTAEKNLHIFGSLTLIAQMSLEFEGNVLFESNQSGNAIRSEGKKFLKNVTFNGAGGWQLSDSLTLIRDLLFLQGSLRTNDQTINCQRFESRTTQPRTLVLGNSHVKLQTPDYMYLWWSVNATQFTLDAGGSTIEFLFFGALDKGGEPTLAYNRVIFRMGADVRCWEDRLSEMSIDTLTTYGGGALVNKQNIRVWEVFRGVTYMMQANDTFTIGKIIALPGCDRMIEFKSDLDANTAYLRLEQELNAENLIVKDIQLLGPAKANAYNSVDLGNTMGWNIVTGISRTLYWVGGGGKWHDPAHWSLSSGGAGGECIPTPLDDVVFDSASFSTPFPYVDAHVHQTYARDITFANIRFQPNINIYSLHFFGSIKSDSSLWNGSITVATFRGTTSGNTLRTVPLNISHLVMDGSGTLRMAGPNSFYGLDFRNGTFDANGQALQVRDVSSSAYYAPNRRTFKLGGSKVSVSGSDSYWTWRFESLVNMVPDSSTVEFTGAVVHAFQVNAFRFHKVFFAHEAGNAKLESGAKESSEINHLEFRGNGTLLGKYTLDSLVFAAGKSYQLDTRSVHKVRSYWQMIGNNCRSIALSSTQGGVKDSVNLENATLLADFVQMRDQLALGGQTYYAGSHSTDIGNSNKGWTFGSPEEYVDEGILGKDIVFCKSGTATLDARTFSPGESYRWSDGSTQPLLNVTRPGSYWVELRYTDNCVLRDSIKVLEPQEFQPVLPKDTTLCAGDTLYLDLRQDLLGLTYLWQDSTRQGTYAATKAGTYRIEYGLNGCTAADSMVVKSQALPVFDLGPDIAFCPGERDTLLATTTAATAVRWQDGSSLRRLEVRAPGLYTATVFEGHCFATDSVRVAHKPVPDIDLGPDKAPCPGESVSLTPTSPGAVFSWQDGSRAASFTVTANGLYWVEANLDGCRERDSVQVTYRPTPSVNLGRDTTLCAGQSLSLQSAFPGATFLWSTGTTASVETIRQAGTYWLEADLNGCKSRDSVQVDVLVLPLGFLGADRVLCPSQSDTLRVNIALARSYRWQDNSTNPTFIVRQSGAYSVAVAIAHCTARDTVSIAYRAPLNFSLGRDTTICESSSLTLASNIPDAALRWQDGSTQNSLNVGTAGLYWAEATRDNCSERDTIVVSQQALPRFELGADTTLCEGQSLSLRSPSLAGAIYRWSNGATTPDISLNTNGQYVLTVTFNRCSFSDAREIRFNPLPRFTLGPDQTPCPGNAVAWTPDAPGASFKWQNGSTGPSFTAMASGLYWAEATLNGCSWRDSAQVTYRPAPMFSLGRDTTLCAGQTLLLNPVIPNAALLWSTGVTASAETVRQAGIYWLEADLDGCKSRDSIQVDYTIFPPDWLGSARMLCEGQSVVLSAQTPKATYRWQDGTTAATLTAVRTGNYAVRVQVGHCEGRDSVALVFNPLPVFNLGKDTTLCTPASITLNAPRNADRYIWSNGSVAGSVTLTQAGIAWAEVSRDGCTWRDTIRLAVQTPPIPVLGRDTTICTDRPYALSAGVQAARYQWQDGSTQPGIRVQAAGLYSVTVSDGLCSASDSIRVDTRTCVRYSVYVPNAFSPDGNGINDAFRPLMPPALTVLEYAFRVFDRWGNLVFQSMDSSEGWDGTKNGVELSQGTYVYVLLLRYRDDGGEGEETITGEINLLR